jgi:hypothetical protein
VLGELLRLGMLVGRGAGGSCVPHPRGDVENFTVHQVSPGSAANVVFSLRTTANEEVGLLASFGRSNGSNINLEHEGRIPQRQHRLRHDQRECAGSGTRNSCANYTQWKIGIMARWGDG